MFNLVSEYIKGLGYTDAQVNDRVVAYLKDQVVSSSTDINDLSLQFLTRLGFTTGSINDRFKAWLIDKLGVGQVNDLARKFNVLGSSINADLLFYAPLRSNLSVVTGTGVATYARSTEATYIDPITGLRVTAAINEPRFEAEGLLLEGESTNIFLNSAAPVTQVIALNPTQYTLRVEGSGSITVTGAGAGTATEGNDLTFTAIAGAATFTVTGTLDTAQLEAAAAASSFILTAGTSVTRTEDTLRYDGTNVGSTLTDKTIALSYQNNDPDINSGMFVMSGVGVYEIKHTNSSTFSVQFNAGANIVGALGTEGRALVTHDVAGDKLRKYIDGVYVVGGDATGVGFTDIAPSLLIIGAPLFSGRAWQGHLTEIKIYDRLLTDAEAAIEC